MEYCIIIGNGFDLDLGLKTRYSDFIESIYFHSLVNGKDPLAMKLHKRFTACLWSDMELEFTNPEYSEQNIAGYKQSYKHLKKQLSEYIKSENVRYKQNKNQQEYTSKAEIFMSHVVSLKDYKIFNFNYTDTALSLIGNKKSKHTYVHQSYSKDIILGTQLNNVSEDFVIKSNHKNYNHKIIGTWIKSAHIVIFGHSLGITDSDYFVPLFANASDNNSPIKSIDIIQHSQKDNMIVTRLQDYNAPSNKVNTYYTENKSIGDFDKYCLKILIRM